MMTTRSSFPFRPVAQMMISGLGNSLCISIIQSTFNGWNDSNACSIVALVIVKGIHQVRCALKPFRVLLKDWVTLPWVPEDIFF